MPSDNVDLVQAGFDAYLRGDEPAMLELAAPDIIVTQFPDQLDVRDYHGHEGLVSLQLAQQIPPGRVLQADIKDNHPFARGIVVRQKGIRGRKRLDAQAFIANQAFDGLAEVCVIIDDKYGSVLIHTRFVPSAQTKCWTGRSMGASLRRPQNSRHPSGSHHYLLMDHVACQGARAMRIAAKSLLRVT